MTVQQQIYKCGMCGNMVAVTHAGPGQLVCCNQPMTLLIENTTDAAQEKHIPVIEKVDGGYKVSVGSVLHPMTEDHLIEWIELTADGKTCCQFLAPDQAPEVIFQTNAQAVSTRAYCNLHGLWKG
jgi:superoxide reductase